MSGDGYMIFLPAFKSAELLSLKFLLFGRSLDLELRDLFELFYQLSLIL
jgi:hypothetical protein